MPDTPEVLRYSAFAETANGGNPAGVVVDAAGLNDTRRLSIAADVGYSETAFLSPRVEDGEYDVAYFSPVAEVPFCGHATIAAAVALAERGEIGELVFHIAAGPVPIRTSRDGAGHVIATLTSVAPRVEQVSADDVDVALRALDWARTDLDPDLPPRIAFAGARHLILAARTRERLADLHYDFDALRSFMLDHDLTTVDLVWRERGDIFHARNAFPVGGVVEDPATGAAAAAFGAYLRELGRTAPPAAISIRQGDDMGRPSRLTVDIPADRAEISVTGRAVLITP